MHQISNQGVPLPGLGAYPSQINPKITIDDANDEALINKLNELENYLATNPTKYSQQQNPMAMFNVGRPGLV